MKNILITGTSRGIGLELAKTFLDEGHTVIGLSRDLSGIEALASKRIHGFSFDITKQKDIDKMTTYIQNTFSQIDIVIHNAGALIAKPLGLLTYEDFKTVYDVNVFGIAMLNKALVKFLPKKAHVVTISSIGGVEGSVKFPGLAAYSSSKGAANILSELLAEEYKDQEIIFNTLALGAVQTQMLKEAFPDFKANTSPEEMANYIKDFALTGNQFFNGKTLQVSNSTP